MARAPLFSRSSRTRTSLSFFQRRRFLPLAEKQKDMNLGSWVPMLSPDDTDLEVPFGFSGLGSGRGDFLGLSLASGALLKKELSLDGLLFPLRLMLKLWEAGSGAGGRVSICFSSSGTTSGRSGLYARNSGIGTSSMAFMGLHFEGGEVEAVDRVECHESERPSEMRDGRTGMPGDETVVGAGDGTEYKDEVTWVRVLVLCDRAVYSSERKQADGICRVFVTIWRHCGQKDAPSNPHTPCEQLAGRYAYLSREGEGQRSTCLGELLFP
jgi:hypothetical protein